MGIQRSAAEDEVECGRGDRALDEADKAELTGRQVLKQGLDSPREEKEDGRVDKEEHDDH